MVGADGVRDGGGVGGEGDREPVPAEARRGSQRGAVRAAEGGVWCLVPTLPVQGLLRARFEGKVLVREMRIRTGRVTAFGAGGALRSQRVATQTPKV